jgi:hypothetical protein
MGWSLRKAKIETELVETVKANWIGHILRKNWFLKHVIGRKI